MLKLIRPEMKYVESYCKTVDTVAKEKKYLSAGEGFPLESTTEFVKNLLEQNIPQLFVINTETDQCVGWCDALKKEDGIGYIGTGLRKEYRNQGVGSQLLCKIIELSKKYGYSRLELDVRASNRRAIHVYEKAGFKMYQVRKDRFVLHNNTVLEDVIQMELVLEKG